MVITAVREKTVPIASPIANAYIDFSQMTCSVVAVVTDVVREGKRVVGYGFSSNGRYGQGSLIRERFAPRLLGADPKTLIDEENENLDPGRIWACLMSNEKPGGHGERSVAVGAVSLKQRVALLHTFRRIESIAPSGPDRAQWPYQTDELKMQVFRAD